MEIFEAKEIRILGTVDEPLFCATDVAAHIDDSHDYVRTVSKYTLGEYTQKIEGGSTGRGRPAVWFLTEAGLYKYLMQSKKEKAEEFQRFVYKLLKEERKRTVDAIQLALKIERTKTAALEQSEVKLYRAANIAREQVTSLTRQVATLQKAKQRAEDADFLRRMGRAHLTSSDESYEAEEGDDSDT